MTDWQLEFLERCCSEAGAGVVAEGAFSPGPAIRVGRRDVAHFDADRVLDVRLTKAVIRARRAELKADDRVTLRGSGSDWIEISVESGEDLQWATGIAGDAIAANASDP